jgi:hypothetical protein
MTPQVTASIRPQFHLCRRIPEPGQQGWRRFLYFLFIYMTFEGLIRRSLPLYNLEILLLKDAGLLVFYIYYLLCVKPNLPRWRSPDRVLTMLVILFVAVNAIGLVKASRYGVIPVLLGLKANFWYVPVFFIGRRYFTSYRQIGAFWSRLSWLLIPVLCVGVWQVLFGSFTPYVAPTGTLDAAAWAAAGSGSMRNNTDGTLIATVASTFYGARLAVFAAIWLPLMTVLCLTDQKRTSFLRIPYLYIAFASALVSVFISANRTAVALSIGCVAILVVSAGARHSAKFLARVTVIAVLTLILMQAYRSARRSDVLESQFHAFASFFSGLLDTAGPDVHGSRYSVIGADIVRGIEVSLADVGPFGSGLGLMTQGAVYIDADVQAIFDVQRGGDAQADSQWVRLIIELGIPGLVLYLAIAFRALWRLVIEALRVRRQSWRDGLVASFAPVLLFLYLGLAHKHAGFVVDPMFQCYLYFVTGAVYGVAARASRGKPA